MDRPSHRALDGLLVVALEQAVAAPYCTAQLAAAGARVIKIERDEGDFARQYDHVAHGESAYFVWLNRGKESLVLDLKQPADSALLGTIMSRADIFVQNLAPGAVDRLGFGAAALRARYPRLVTCDISGYGEDGPYKDMKAYDLLIQCETGLASITGGPDQPGRVGVSIADIACGMYAHGAILQALYERERTGQGAQLAVSLFDALADWMNVPFLHAKYGAAPKRVGLAHPTIAPYGVFATADGKQVVISIQNEREWQTFCRQVLLDESLLADPRFATNAERVANRPACDGAVALVFGRLTRAALVERLNQARVAFGAVNSLDDLVHHAQLRTVEAATPSGPVSIIANPVRRPVGPGPILSVPALGQQSDSIRAEFS